MSIFEAILLGVIQGLTEFLPISSSGHLVLLPWWLGWEHAGLAFDTFLHLGTLLAVLVYFWREWWMLLRALVNRVRGRDYSRAQLRLLWVLIVGTIPAAVIGYAFDDFFASLFETPLAAAIFLIVTGFLLVFAERFSHGQKDLLNLEMPDALSIGLAQALAIAPGISRSGSTIAAGMWRQLSRPSAARFSFLLGTPIIFAAGMFQLKDLVEAGVTSESVTPLALLAGFLAAAITGILCIRFLLRYLENHSLLIFALYVWTFAGLSIVRYIFL